MNFIEWWAETVGPRPTQWTALERAAAKDAWDYQLNRIQEMEADIERFRSNNRYQRGYHDGQREGMIAIGQRAEEILRLKDELLQANSDRRREHDLRCKFQGENEAITGGPEWINVNDKMPEENEYVLGYSKDDGAVVVKYDENGLWINAQVVDVLIYMIAAWMPLPKPPTI